MGSLTTRIGGKVPGEVGEGGKECARTEPLVLEESVSGLE